MRNSTIEIYRLFFSILIVLCHIGNRVWIPLEDRIFQSAWLGVEFFFILSGYLMSNSIYKIKDHYILGIETINYVYNKVKFIYPTYLFAFIAEFIMEKCVGIKSGPFLYKIYDLFFLRIFGFHGDVLDLSVGASWFLHALFVGMFILYPIARRFTDTFHYIIAPLTAAFILGFFSNCYGHLLFALQFENNICLGLLRCIGDLCCGSFVYALCKLYKERASGNLVKSLYDKKFFLYGQLVALIVLLHIMMDYDRSQMNFVSIIFFMILIGFAFLDERKSIFDKLNVSWIADFSLALYLNHIIWIRCLSKLALPLGLIDRYAFVLVLSVALSFCCICTVKLVREKVDLL